jgi:hypothetical protein
MDSTEIFLSLLDREADASRRVLERTPTGRHDWKPHAKSMPLGYLASLVATMPSWIAMAIGMDELDLAPAGGGSPPRHEWSTTADLVRLLDESVAKAVAALRGTSEQHLLTPWKLLVTGKVVMERPRHVVIADTFTHQAHHRGQLTVYLRLNDAVVPAIYGPTADEPTFG